MATISTRPVTTIARPKAQPKLETLGRVVGTQGAKAFKPSQVMKDVRVGVVGSVPSDALFASQKYRRGEVKANEYVGEVLNTSLGMGAWTVAAAGNATLRAGERITLQPGFLVRAGGGFRAEIDPSLRP